MTPGFLTGTGGGGGFDAPRALPGRGGGRDEACSTGGILDNSKGGGTLNFCELFMG